MSEWYQRDASWWNHPDVRSIKKWHLRKENGFALCNSKVFLDDDTHTANPDVGKCMRCEKLQDILRDSQTT